MKKVYLQSADALGTNIELRLVTHNQAPAEKWFILLWKEIGDFENRFSRFRHDSELSLFNKQAGEKVKISETFKKLLETAKHYSVLSEGLFNPFILPDLQRAGYKNSLDKTHSPAPDYSKRSVADYTSLEIGSDWAMIPSNTALDMGGIGKGYLADQLGALLENNVEDYCLSLGGDVCVKGSDEDGPWKIDIQSAENREKNIAKFTGDKDLFGIATSGVTREISEQTQVHIINPKTGQPIDLSNNICTVVANNVTMADVMASCILIGGKDLAKRLVGNGLIKAVLLQGKEFSPPFILGEGFYFAPTKI